MRPGAHSFKKLMPLAHSQNLGLQGAYGYNPLVYPLSSQNVRGGVVVGGYRVGVVGMVGGVSGGT